ncbi:MAG: phenylalanine--tRNA ligase subunit beta [Candidatus Taylorbacteria bacterium]|nr:phenylalanine--tRNA ligase subunit beta [Candidatus Taylorbacteria bacterium]
MLISYKWLQGYFEEKLPEPEKLAERITFSFTEIEGIEKKGDDTILDVKVLPDRACYALSHRGVAYEVGAILGLPKKEMNWPAPKVSGVRRISIKVEAPELCPRYTARVIENINQKENPWVKEHLEAVGQRSINPIVDGANIVMLDMGQPLHAFDADKVEGGIVVRMAKKGEKIVTLDNREVNLDESVLIIADEESPLAIAGIKGGKKAEVTSATKNLILEAASFNASYIRKTSEKLGIKTDASKRYENKLSPEYASRGMEDFSALLFEMDKAAEFGEITDIYSSIPKNIGIDVTQEYISKKLGVEVSSKQIEETFERLLIKFEKEGDTWRLTPPLFRVDLVIPEDVAEEVGRILGYDKIPAVLPSVSNVAEIPKSFYYEWKIREALANVGFSEVMTSSFYEEGSVAIEKPLAEDKKYARENLRGGFEKALKVNVLNAPLLGDDKTCIFEIGRIFTKDGERMALALGIAGPKKKIVGILESGIKTVSDALGVSVTGEIKDGVFECTLDDSFQKLSDSEKWDISIPHVKTDKFVSFSPYPFIVRDVALFVSPDTTPESVAKVIKESAGSLVVRGPELFDEFIKDGKKSLAFRLIFQSFEKTLTDEEVNGFMEKIYSAVKGGGWEVR